MQKAVNNNRSITLNNNRNGVHLVLWRKKEPLSKPSTQSERPCFLGYVQAYRPVLHPLPVSGEGGLREHRGSDESIKKIGQVRSKDHLHREFNGRLSTALPQAAPRLYNDKNPQAQALGDIRNQDVRDHGENGDGGPFLLHEEKRKEHHWEKPKWTHHRHPTGVKVAASERLDLQVSNPRKYPHNQ